MGNSHDLTLLIATYGGIALKEFCHAYFARLFRYGEHKAKSVFCRPMATRAMTEGELKELSRQLAHLSQPTVRDFYRVAHAACAMQPGKLPEPRALQELVTAWKLLRKWRR